MSPDYKRADRVGERIVTEISDLLLKKVNDPDIGFVTVTGAKVSDDLRDANVYFSVWGDAARKEAAMAGLRRATSFFQREVFKRLGLKVPTLIHVRLDETREKAEKIDLLLREVAKQREQDQAQAGQASQPEPEKDDGKA